MAAHTTDVDPPLAKGRLSSQHVGNDFDIDEAAGNATADDLLDVLGYQAELVRTRSTWQVAFMSFVLASIPYGLSTTFYYPLVGGGPANIIWGWVGVTAIILCVAASLGEITSIYPTAGGVYYQAFMLSPPWCRRITAWVTGWSYVLGNVTITLAVNFGTALFIYGCLNIFTDGDGNPIFPGEPYQLFLLFLLITLVCNAISAFGNKWLPLLDPDATDMLPARLIPLVPMRRDLLLTRPLSVHQNFAIFWTFAGVIALDICVLVIAKHGRRDGAYVFAHFEPSSGYPAGWSFCVGLLQAAYATSSTGMVISMCEEVKEPSTQVPKALVGTILLNFIAGLVFLIPLLFVFPDVAKLINDPYGQPVPAILVSAIGNKGGAFALTVPLIVLGILCGVGCTTAASRCTWAFSRDGAIPGYQWWKQVNPTLGLPLNAMMLSMVVQILLGLIYFGSTAAFNAFSGVGVIFLTVSYATPIAVSLLGGRRQLANAPFHLGKLGTFCNVVAIAWSSLAIPLFCFPSAIPVTKISMNYASVVFVGFTAISAAWYFVWGRRNYQGPPAADDETIRRRQSSVTAAVK